MTQSIRPLPGLLLVPLLSILAVGAPSSPAAAQAPFHPALDPQAFPVPESLVPAVEFWRDVFARYESTQTLIHDDEHLDVVFTVVDVGDMTRSGASAAAIERAQRDRVRDATRRYQQVLRRLGGDRSAEASDADLARVRGLYAGSARGADDFRAAASRVRGQAGLKDRFREAIEISGMFMPGIEQILGEHGVPTIVKSLPFVESMYNYQARSRVGASGAWQFTPGTARQYLQMDSAVDGRSDVWLAADGAARLLADNYQRVLSWPLALTAYNHGIDAVVERYQSRTFGFASRNFYAEFVTAATVFADRADLFPGIEPLPPVEFDTFTPGRFVSLLDLASLTDTDVDTLVTLNPALHEDVGRGTLGEFNWSSQHLDDEVLQCRDGNGDGQTGRVGLRCVRLVGRRQRGVRSSNGSGRRSREGCRVRMPLCPVACRRPWVVVGSVRAVVCRRSAWRPDRLATCPLRSGKRSRSCELRAPGCVTLPVGSGEPRRLSRESYVATRRLGAAVWRIGRRLRSGTAPDVPSARRSPSWPRTIG